MACPLFIRSGKDTIPFRGKPSRPSNVFQTQGNVWAWVFCRTVDIRVAKLLELKQNVEPPQQGGTRSRPSAGIFCFGTPLVTKIGAREARLHRTSHCRPGCASGVVGRSRAGSRPAPSSRSVCARVPDAGTSAVQPARRAYDDARRERHPPPAAGAVPRHLLHLLVRTDVAPLARI